MMKKYVRILSTLVLFSIIPPAIAQTQEDLITKAKDTLLALGIDPGNEFAVIRSSALPGRQNEDPLFIVTVKKSTAEVHIQGAQLDVTMVTFEDPQSARTRGLNFDPNLPILTRKRAHEIGQNVLEVFGLPSNVVLEKERWAEGVQSAGKAAKGRGTIGLSYYSKPHGIYDGFGNHLEVILDHQTGEFAAIVIRNGYTYEEPINLIPLHQAKSIAARALKRDLGDVTHSKLVYITDFGSWKTGGPGPREKSKTCVLAYNVQCGQGMVMVNAKTGHVEYVDELGAASGPVDAKVASENQAANSRGNVLPLESVGSDTSAGSQRIPAWWLIFPGVIIAAGLIAWKVRRPKGG
ncbi:hypothetical protein QPK87_17350 [Kamptonema cortianum]|nr:hypothetical protein [Geitlerinema splendidum]MDK3158321.1 hypothetical protein [Kamptonema cortianum]